ncbi:MAG: diadenylate cyclase CdaA [Spirochaetaceae bacterium]|nr:diadenylate cyclase CdaA [Spirochaetaceae bacterium]
MPDVREAVPDVREVSPDVREVSPDVRRTAFLGAFSAVRSCADLPFRGKGPYPATYTLPALEAAGVLWYDRVVEWLQQLFSFYNNIIRPALDVALLAFLLYKLFGLLVKTQAVQMARGAVVLALVFAIAYLFKLSTLQWILRSLAPGLLVVIAVVFQPELRKLITRLGFEGFFRPDKKPRLGQHESIITACETLSEEKRGALIVFSRRNNLRDIIETGTRLNAEISSSLIRCVFEFDTTLHDGAMVIQNGRIIAAGCILPLSEQQEIKKSFGTRHRAALGMSEHSDAVILVVSEETGAISLAFEGQLHYDLSAGEVHRKLRALLDRAKRGADEYEAENFDAQTGGSEAGKEEVFVE